MKFSSVRSWLSKYRASAMWTLVAVIPLITACVALAQDSPEPPAKLPDGQIVKDIAADDKRACLACHSGTVADHPAMSAEFKKTAAHYDFTCQDCHSSVTGAPHTKEMLEELAACSDCHSDEHDLVMTSAHAKKDIVPGDHPTCVSCHGKSNAHDVLKVSAWTRNDKVALCSDCHRDTERMNRYGVDPDAVPSYEESFHGKTLLRFGNQQVAICSDCHGAHEMKDPGDPKSKTSRENAATTCSVAGCHPGANVNFAMSGANHLRLKLKEDPILRGIDWFFRALVFGMIFFMLGGVGLDLRMKVFKAKEPPKGGRAPGLMVSLSYLSAIFAITCGALGYGKAATIGFIVAVGMILLAYMTYFMERKDKPPVPYTGREYKRFTPAQRTQHLVLMICVTLLVLTGLPLRFYNTTWLATVYDLLGGAESARALHRVAALGLVGLFFWHTTNLFIRWWKNGFSFKTWTMFPGKQDLKDFVQISKWYLGFNVPEPKYGKFQFKQKMDYLAEYWGVPLMVITGFILWFPIYWGNRLPEIAISAALLAHSWEATLAFLAIITWHLYNEQFSPDRFPGSRWMVTGTLTRDEMHHHHALELERIDQEEEAQKAEPKPESGENI